MKVTRFDLMVAGVICVMAVVLLLNAVGFAKGNGSVSFGINGMTEVRCIEGYKFVISQDGVTKQILDEFGKGAKCDTVPQPIK